MVRYLSLLLLMIFGSRFLPAQTISNVQARQEGLEIIITYDMAGQLQSGDEIKVGYSTDGGRNYKPISGADGDVGKNVKTGTGREISFFANDALAGKNARLKVEAESIVVFTTLENIHVSPNPASPGKGRFVQFNNLPNECTIRIFTIVGELVATVKHDAPTGYESWNMRNENNLFISAGIYIYIAETPGGDQKSGKILIK